MPVTETESGANTRSTPTTQYKSLARRFAVRLCVVVTLCVAILAGVELYSYWRYLPIAGDVMEPAIKLELKEGQNAAEREYWREFEQANKVTYHQYVLWRRQPYQGEEIVIDENGVRRTLHTRCDDKTFTIWMFGDSVMWGAGAPDGETIPSFIAADYEKAGKPVCIVNYAEKGWSNTQEVVGLIEYLKHASRKPDVVFFYDGGTEAFAAYQNHRPDVHSNYNSFKKFLDNWGASQKAGFSYLTQTNTYRFLEKIAVKEPFHRRDAGDKPELDTDAMAQAVMANYLQNMDLVGLLARQYGFRPIFAWYPNMAVGHKPLSPYEQQVLDMEYKKFPNLGVMYQAAYNQARKVSRPELVYLGDLLDDQQASLYVGISHLRPEGNQIVADRLFRILESSPGAAVADRGK